MRDVPQRERQQVSLAVPCTGMNAARLVPGRAALCLLGALWFAGPTLAANSAHGADIGMVKTARGTVTIQRGAESLPAQPGTAIRQADVISTGPESAVGITMKDNSVLSAGPRSTLQMDRFSFDSRTQTGVMEATLKRGSLSGISGAIARNSPEAVQFKTSSITLGVRGTHFILEAAEREE